MKNILVAGGAGYIGTHMCKYLANKGYVPIVLDNLINGHESFVKWGPFIKGSIGDMALLEQIFVRYRISAVMHFAALCYVGESVREPLSYYENNVMNTINLLKSMVNNNIDNFIFSSSCATYGEPEYLPIDEKHPQRPINPYGKTKLMVERILDDLESAYGLKFICLRYFNAAGADIEGEIGERHMPETHLIPMIIQSALEQHEVVNIFGEDYPTKDGTCIRDYIHVQDLVEAHFMALERLLNGEDSGKYNLSNSCGYSVKEIIEAVSQVAGRKVISRNAGRRLGDPAVLIGSNEKAFKELKWSPRFSDLHKILETAWAWHLSEKERQRN